MASARAAGGQATVSEYARQGEKVLGELKIQNGIGLPPEAVCRPPEERRESIMDVKYFQPRQMNSGDSGGPDAGPPEGRPLAV
jgi:hypothetical protein